MALSRVMASSSSATSNITRQSSIYSLKSVGSINIDDLFPAIESDGGRCDTSSATISMQGSVGAAGKVEEVWSEIDGVGGEMTLEDFLERNNGFGSGRAGFLDPIRRRGRKRDSTLDPVEKAALQRQKRMIKNRESAARSRERKQAYTSELESLVAKLEEENAQLLRHQEECNKKRLKQVALLDVPGSPDFRVRFFDCQVVENGLFTSRIGGLLAALIRLSLVESLIPVTEQRKPELRKPPRMLRRTCSMEW